MRNFFNHLNISFRGFCDQRILLFKCSYIFHPDYTLYNPVKNLKNPEYNCNDAIYSVTAPIKITRFYSSNTSPAYPQGTYTKNIVRW
jgi:hypothetical protein